MLPQYPAQESMGDTTLIIESVRGVCVHVQDWELILKVRGNVCTKPGWAIEPKLVPVPRSDC